MKTDEDGGVHATIEYALDWTSKSGDDQRGHINITTATGTIEATWSASGGKGDGCELISNTTTEFSDEEAEELLDSADLCQGIGTYEADVTEGEYGWLTLVNVKWLDPKE